MFFKTLQKYSLKKAAVLMVCYLTTSFLYSCTDKKNKQIDVSKVPIQFQSFRYDKLMYQCDTNKLEAAVEALGKNHPEFTSVFFNEMTGFARNGLDPTFYASFRHFLTYKDYRNLYDTVQAKYPDVKDLNSELKRICQRVTYYFPNKKVNTVYYFISGLNQWSAVTLDSIIGIGLDMHLGKQYPFYESIQLPQYQIDKCEREYIPVNVSKVIYEDMFPFAPEGKTLLEMILERGKQLYFTEHILPEAKDQLLAGYTPAQLQWCQENESMVWSFFAKKNYLYSTNWQEILRYVNDGPTSTGMPSESPGNIGSWMGWQIVRAYAKNNPNKNLKDILTDKIEAKEFVRLAKYKP